MARGRRDLAAIVGPVLVKPHAWKRYLIAEGPLQYSSAARVHAHFRNLVAGA